MSTKESDIGTVVDSEPAKPGRGAVVRSLQEFAAGFDAALKAYLPLQDGLSPLVEAMRYSALAPGKRLRPYLVARCCDLAGGWDRYSKDNLCGTTPGAPPAGDRSHTLHPAMHVAAAVECVHVFSLIHDDLPAVDDDDLRRGQPTSHKVYGEANAILAGDALLSLGFELLVRHTADARIAVRLVRELAEAVGAAGMIGGQAADIAQEKRPPDLSLVKAIHARKTARLIEASCRLGVIYADGGDDILEALGRYGRGLGRAFQITDDLLDVTATREALGKAVGKDAKSCKQTYPGCVGIDKSRRAAAEASQQALAALADFDQDADELRALARFVVERGG